MRTLFTPPKLLPALPRPVLARLVLAATLAAILAGCQLFAPSPAEDLSRLPDLPRASRTVGPGSQVAFHDTSFQVVEVSPDEDGHLIALSVRQGKRTSLLNVRSGEYALDGDFLIRFESRPELQGSSSLLMALHHLPSLLPRTVDWPISRKAAPRDMLLLPDGFVAVDRILDNDFLRTDDDRAGITVYRKGTEVEKATLVEFHSLVRGDLVISAGDIFTGDTPGDGFAQLRIEKTDRAWPAELPRQEILLGPNERAFAFDCVLTLETVQPEMERLLLTIEGGSQEADVFLTPGESVRWERLEVRADAITGQSAQVTVFHHKTAVHAASQRLPERSVQQQAREQAQERTSSAPTDRQVQVGGKVAYAGAEFTLQSVRDNNPMNLFDDSAEFTVKHGNLFETVVLRERDRYTIHGNNQWWIISLTDATPDPVPGNGKATIHLETGSFFHMQEQGE